MILVAGATGVLGTEIVQQLRSRDKPVRALVRKTSDLAKVDRLRSSGAIIVEGDLTDVSSLERVCQGIDTVITTATVTSSRTPGDTIAAVDHAGQLSLVDASVKAGVSHYIFISIGGNFEVDCPLLTAKRAVEQRIIDSGMSYAILRANCFMEFWLAPMGGFDYPNHKATIYGSGKNPLSWISMVDVARFAVIAVDSPAARNTVLELGGPDKLSPEAAVRIFEEVSDQPFRLEYVPEEALRAQREAATDPLQQTFAALLLAMAYGAPVDMEAILKRFPMNLTSVRDYAMRTAVAAV